MAEPDKMPVTLEELVVALLLEGDHIRAAQG